MKPQVLEAIQQSAAVPSMPQVVLRCLEIMQDPNFSYDDLTKVLSTDAGTVSELLRLANSALFGLSRKVVSLRSALTMLGPRRTRALVLGRYLVETMGGQNDAAIDVTYFWRRSLARAVLTARLAESFGVEMRDEAFIAAMVAAIGIPVMAQAFPRQYGPIAARYAPHAAPITPDQEQAAVETTHGEVGAAVLQHWGLPDAVCGAVKDYQDPSRNGAPPAFSALINASDRVAKLLCEVPDTEAILPTCCAAMELIDGDLASLAHVLGDIERDVEELASLLHVDVIASGVYPLIAKTIREQLAAPVGA